MQANKIKHDPKMTPMNTLDLDSTTIIVKIEFDSMCVFRPVQFLKTYYSIPRIDNKLISNKSKLDFYSLHSSNIEQCNKRIGLK